jgi:hypothetical protein
MPESDIPGLPRSSAPPIAAEARETTTLPLIACSLDTTDKKQRLADWSTLLREATRRDEAPNGVRYSFAGNDELESRLRALAADEKACCAFLDFDVVRTGEVLQMTVTAPPDAATALRFIFPPT